MTELKKFLTAIDETNDYVLICKALENSTNAIPKLNTSISK
jgi:hypothetical protein